MCLNSTYFNFKGNLYAHVEVISMGSPLSLVVANIYMEHFEKEALESFALQPK
jgi:hypothetical protein